MGADLESFVSAILKAELLLHLEGAIAAPTVVDLARKHGVALPIVREVSELNDIQDLGAFLKVGDRRACPHGLRAAWIDEATKSALLADCSAEIARAPSP